jgi:hypothetical protein
VGAVNHLRIRTDICSLPDGTRVLVVDAVIPDDAPEQLREALARRAIVNRGGTCPCGAVMRRPNRAQRRAGATVATIAHEPTCPAGDAVLTPLLTAWEAQP